MSISRMTFPDVKPVHPFTEVGGIQGATSTNVAWHEAMLDVIKISLLLA